MSLKSPGWPLRTQILAIMTLFVTVATLLATPPASTAKVLYSYRETTVCESGYVMVRHEWDDSNGNLISVTTTCFY